MRIKQLDILRAIAIILVFGSHLYASDLWLRIGWVGVELFFVLSGFLVSGLIFTEYKKYGQIKPGRFLVRRGLKIYPAFYALVLITILLRLKFKIYIPSSEVVREIFFVQNYGPGLWVHTWSLAVEEHFYLLLIALLFFMQKYASEKDNPFRPLPKIILLITLVEIGARFLTAIYIVPYDIRVHYTPTHLRLDSLLFGVLISYYYHYHKAAFLDVFRGRLKWLFLISMAFVSTCIFADYSGFFMITIGYTFIYIGFGGVLILSLYEIGELPGLSGTLLRNLSNGLAYIGTYSYSIYLWHLMIASWGIVGILRRVSPIKFHYLIEFGIYVLGSIVVGIVMAKLIEQPVLKFRDRLYPARSDLSLAVKRIEFVSTSH